MRRAYVQQNWSQHRDRDCRMTSHEHRTTQNDNVISDIPNPRGQQNDRDKVDMQMSPSGNDRDKVDMQMSPSGNECWSENGETFDKQKALNSEIDMGYQQKLFPKLNRNIPSEGCYPRDRSGEKRETDHPAKRSCSQILALIGNGQGIDRTLGKETLIGSNTAGGHAQMCAGVDMTSICEVYLTEGPERTNISQTSETVGEMTGDIEGTIVDEDVEHLDEAEDTHPVAGAVRDSEKNTAVNIIGDVSPMARSSDGDIDQLEDGADADSEKVCFDICFSPLSGWESADVSSDDECPRGSDTHIVNVSQHSDYTDLRQELSVGLDAARVISQPCEREGIDLVSRSWLSHSQFDEVDCSDVPDYTASENTVGCHKGNKEINEPIDCQYTDTCDIVNCHTEENYTDCHSVADSDDHDIVHCHTQEGDIEKCDIMCSGSDTINSETVKCLSPDGYRDCVIAANADVVCHTDDTNTVDFHTGDSERKSDNQSVGSGHVNSLTKCHVVDDVTVSVNFSESGNIVKCLLPDSDIIDSHPGSDVINGFKAVCSSNSSSDHFDHKNNCVNADDTAHSNVDSTDSNIDVDGAICLVNNENNVDSKFDFIRRGNTFVSQTDDISGSSSHVDDRNNEGCHVSDRDDDSCHVDDGHMFVGRENDSDNNTRYCYFNEKFREDCHSYVTDDKHSCITDGCDKDSHFNESCKRNILLKSSSNKVCSTDENKFDGDTHFHDDGQFVDEKNYSWIGDNGVDTDDKPGSNFLSPESAADKTVTLESGVKTHSDRVDSYTPDGDAANTCRGDFEEKKKKKQEDSSNDAVPQQTRSEDDKTESDTEGAVIKCAEVYESMSVSNDRCADTDSMDTTDTMYSSSLDSLHGNSPQQQQQQWWQQRQQRQIEPDWLQHQRHICLSPSMSRKPDIHAAAKMPTVEIPGIIPHIAVCCKRQKGNHLQQKGDHICLLLQLCLCQGNVIISSHRLACLPSVSFAENVSTVRSVFLWHFIQANYPYQILLCPYEICM